MIRFHMVDHQIIQWPVIEYKLNIFKELQGDGGIYGVDQGGLFVQNEIRVVGYAAGDGNRFSNKASRRSVPPTQLTKSVKVRVQYIRLCSLQE